MSFVKNFPWLSLTLLLFAYFNLGWVLHASHSPWWIWLLAIVLCFCITEALAFPLSLFRTLFSKWIRSDSRAFFAAIILAFFSVVFLSHASIFAHVLLLTVAATLARLDLQTVAISELKAFSILIVFSMSGLSLGVFVNWGVRHSELILKFLNQFF